MGEVPYLFLDCGAFSFMRSCRKIWKDSAHEFWKTPEYAAYFEEYMQFCGRLPRLDKLAVAALDVIGNAEQSYENWKTMVGRGIDCLPVYHCRDPFHWFERYVREGAAYIAVSAGGPKPMSAIDKMLSQVFRHAQRHSIRIHGFALTSVDIMLRYPFYSVDSISTAATGAYGGIFVPNEQKNRIIKVQVTPRSLGKDHICQSPMHARAYIENYVKTYGFGIEELACDDKARIALNHRAIMDILQNINPALIYFESARFDAYKSRGQDVNELFSYFTYRPGMKWFREHLHRLQREHKKSTREI